MTKLLTPISVDSGTTEAPEAQARRDILETLGAAPETVVFDGQIHRFKVEGDTGPDSSGAGWYIFFGDNVPAGKFGSWKSDNEGIRWRAEPQSGSALTPEEEAEIQRRWAMAKKEHDAELARVRARAADSCRAIWEDAAPAEDGHGYLRKKGVKSHGLRATGDGRLIVPLADIGGALTTLEYIDADGQKRFHPGGMKRGSFFLFPGTTDTRYIVEGYATGASVHEATGAEVIAAMDAGNLLPAAQAWREARPDAKFVFVADNDSDRLDSGKRNVGYEKAKAAADAIGASVVMPPAPGTDANDYARAGGDIAALLGRAKHWIHPYSEALEQPTPVKWLIEKWAQEDAMMMIFGQSGAGKTFVALGMALSVASPRIEHWNGLRVKHGPVVYLAGEGHLGLRARIAGWSAHHDVSESDFYWSEKAVDLNTPQGLTEALTEIRSFNITPALIVVDTLNRFMAGDENKAQDARVMLNNLAALQRECGGAVMLVHHTGVAENAQDRARGSSAWKGAMDIEMQVAADGENSVILRQTKNKDSETAKEILLDKVTVDVPGWLNEYGEQVRTLVMEQSDADFFDPSQPLKLSGLQYILLQAYILAARRAGVWSLERVAEVSRDMVYEEFQSLYTPQTSDSASFARIQSIMFSRSVNELAEMGVFKVQRYGKRIDIISLVDLFHLHQVWGMVLRNELLIPGDE